MKTTIAVAGLVAALGLTVGVAAESRLRGSDTLTDVVSSTLISSSAECKYYPFDGPFYVGGGSTVGQGSLAATFPQTLIQQTAPMTRMLNSAAGFCTQAASTLGRAEGIVFGLDGVSVVANATNWGTCNGTYTADCTPNMGTGLVNNKQITPNPSRTCSVDANCNTAGVYGEVCSSGICRYNIGSWKDALRILFAGQSAAGNNLSQRNCNSPERQYLAANWNTLFQSCSSAACPNGVQHVFRMGDDSATTELFVQLLNLPAIDLTNNVSPFCNVATRGPSFFINPNAPDTCMTDNDCAVPGSTAPPDTCEFGVIAGVGVCHKCWMPVSEFETAGQTAAETNSGPMPPPTAGYTAVPVPTKIAISAGNSAAYLNKFTGPNWTDVQDGDVIRRPCAINEDVCSARGDLGLVLPIEVPVVLGPTSLDQPSYPTQHCTTGKFACFSAIRSNVGALSQAIYEPCLDGADPNVSGNHCPKGQCAYPVISANSTLDPRCLNGRLNNPSGDLNIMAGAKVDARVYNLEMWISDPDTGGFSRLQPRRATALSAAVCNMPSARVATAPGAYYRIHSEHSFKSVGGSPVVCKQSSTAKQIGCLVQASPCSIGYAGRNATQAGTDVMSLKVGGLDPAPQCIRNLLTGGNTYPMARKLYLNTAVGFGNVGGAGSQDDEIDLAKCLSSRSVVDPILSVNGFVTLSATPSTRPTFCEDFNEASVCNSATNVNACKDGPTNPSPIPTCEISDPISSCPGL